MYSLIYIIRKYIKYIYALCFTEIFILGNLLCYGNFLSVSNKIVWVPSVLFYFLLQIFGGYTQVVGHSNTSTTQH